MEKKVSSYCNSVYNSQPILNPREEWSSHPYFNLEDVESNTFKKITDQLSKMFTTSMMVSKKGHVIYSYGDVSEVSYIASVRKSILSLLYGNYVKKNKVNLNSTLKELNIDDICSLSDKEKSATIRDLLKTSSGIYHPQGSPGGDTEDTPKRNSKNPGEHFYYNNWDFNVAGTIFEQETKQTVFEALENDIAVPLQFEDYKPEKQKKLGLNNKSRHHAYHMFLSTRDMARIGVLVNNKGKWNGTQIVPEEWLKDSLTSHVRSKEMGKRKKDDMDYGYFWWLPNVEDWSKAFLAYGNYGQYILCLPQIETVIAHKRFISDHYAIKRNQGENNKEISGVYLNEFLYLSKLIVNLIKDFY